MAEKGYIILADITGYTQYLNDSELDHAQEIITSLINAILRPLHPPILVSRVEGDAVFAYITGEAFYQGQTLLEALEKLYFEFARDLEVNDRNTTCSCKACSNMENLDLKIVAHYGEFGLQQLGQQIDLIGRDVNITHRLLKNSIIKDTGIEAYLFLTQAAIDQMKMQEFAKSLVEHCERYDDVGEVYGYVYDLAPAWVRERERRHIVVAPQEAYVNVELELPIPPPAAWDYLNEPSIRALYRHYDDRPVLGKKNGRLAVGATYHCAHGETVNPETVIDWKPFEYVTFRGSGEILGQTIMTEFTTHIRPKDGSSLITFSYDKPYAGKANFAGRFIAGLWAPVFRLMVKPVMKKGLTTLEELVQEDQRTGGFKLQSRSARA